MRRLLFTGLDSRHKARFHLEASEGVASRRTYLFLDAIDFLASPGTTIVIEAPRTKASFDSDIATMASCPRYD